MRPPVLWSFRRCPYAMRARLAIASAGIDCELREVALRDKPEAFLAAASDGTVPALDTGSGMITESLDIMRWALEQTDPEGWLTLPPEAADLISTADGPFKLALDHTKYASRYPDADPKKSREEASRFLRVLNEMLDGRDWLHGSLPRFTDMAALPFVRQFANIDRHWFDAQPWPGLIRWLDAFLASDRFARIMLKYPQWHPGEDPISFPPASSSVF